MVLIESGGLPVGHDITELTRLNFVALITVLIGLAENDLATYDPQIYEDLPGNQSDVWSDIVVRGGRVLQPGTSEPFRSDLAFDYLRSGRQALESESHIRVPSQIFMIGDACRHGAGQSVNANDMILLAAFAVGVEGWSGKDWLDDDNLARLARLGVATVYWSVGAADHVAARQHADKLMIRGLPDIEVQTDPASFPAVVLSAPPASTGSETIDSILQVLGAADSQDNQALDALWTTLPGTERTTIQLCKDRPASFLMVTPGADGRVDLTASRLISVWLDGHQVV